MAEKIYDLDLTVKGNITGVQANLLALNFDTVSASPTPLTGQLVWNSDESTLDLTLNANVTGQLLQEAFFYVKNQTGATITNGTPIMFDGSVGASGRIQVVKAIADGTYEPDTIVGIATEDILNGGDGFSTWFGKTRGLDTTGTPYGETWAVGDIIYVSAVTAGYLTNVQPVAPNQGISMAVVVVVSATVGELLVRPSWSHKLDQITDVNGTTPLNDYVLAWDNANSYWDATALTESMISDFGTYDNYVSWNLKTESIQRLGIVSGGQVDFRSGTGIDINYTAGGVVEIVNTVTDTTYTGTIPIIVTGTVISHENTSGYKHLPAGGVDGDWLRWDSLGTGDWATFPGVLNIIAGDGINTSGTTDVTINSEGLELITDTNTGRRLIGKTAANYGNIGHEAIDLSHSSSVGTPEHGARGDYSFTGGINTIASETGAVAFGGGSESSGIYSFSCGNNNLSSGGGSFTAGYDNQATNQYDVAMGYNNIASGQYSASFGFFTQATSPQSYSIGKNTKALNVASFVGGKYNIGTSTKTIFEYGIGYQHNDTFSTKNGLEIHGQVTNNAASDVALDTSWGAVVAPELSDDIINDFANDFVLVTRGYVKTKIVAKTGGYTVTRDDEVIIANTNLASLTITLPTASGITGKEYVIKKTIAANTVTIDADGTEKIDDSLTQSLTTQYDSIKVISDGANWWII